MPPPKTKLVELVFELPPYDVIVWYRVSTPGLCERIVARAGRPPDKCFESQGVGELNWGFKTAHEATGFAESLLEIAALDDVFLLSVLATHDEGFGRKVYKDRRSMIDTPV